LIFLLYSQKYSGVEVKTFTVKWFQDLSELIHFSHMLEKLWSFCGLGSKMFLNFGREKRLESHCSRSLYQSDCGLSLPSADYSYNPAQFRHPSSSGFFAFTPSNYVER